MSRGKFARATTTLTRVWQQEIGDHVSSLAWSPDGSLLVASSASGPIALFEADGKPRPTLAGHGFGTASVAWFPSGELLASGGQDGKVRLWNPHSGAETLKLEGGAAWVERVAWSAATSAGRGSSDLSSPRAGRGSPDPAPLLATTAGRGSPDPAPLLATAAGKKLKLWSADGRLLRQYPDHPSTIADIQWQPGTPVLASAAYGQLSLWNPDADEPIGRFEWKGSMLALAWSPDARYIATGDQDATVHFWNVATGEDLQMSGYPSKVRELAWDPTSRYLATGGSEAPCVWDCSGDGPAGTTPIQLEAHTARVSALAWQKAGLLLASGGLDGMVALWHPGRQQGALALAKLGAPLAQLAWSPDDARLAAATEEGRVAVYTIG